jgi:hypothetical protein
MKKLFFVAICSISPLMFCGEVEKSIEINETTRFYVNCESVGVYKGKFCISHYSFFPTSTDWEDVYVEKLRSSSEGIYFLRKDIVDIVSDDDDDSDNDATCLMVAQNDDDE